MKIVSYLVQDTLSGMYYRILAYGRQNMVMVSEGRKPSVGETRSIFGVTMVAIKNNSDVWGSSLMWVLPTGSVDTGAFLFEKLKQSIS